MARTTTSPELSPTRLCTASPCVPTHLLAVAAHGRLDGQGGVTGAHGVVLVGHGRPKQRHDAVAHDLVYRALVAVHRGHQVLQDRVEDLPGFLGVAVGDQLQGALQVGKQHRDLLTLAFQVAARRQNLLGQVRWRVGQRLVFLGAGGWCGWGVVSRPHQHFAVLVHGKLFDLNQL